MLAVVTTSAQTLVAATSGADPKAYPNKLGITVRAPSANTGNIHLGKANTVTAAGALTAGLSLEPGQSARISPIWAADASLIFVISSTGSQNLLWEMDQA
jgi:hypothetical protein